MHQSVENTGAVSLPKKELLNVTPSTVGLSDALQASFAMVEMGAGGASAPRAPWDVYFIRSVISATVRVLVVLGMSRRLHFPITMKNKRSRTTI